MVMQAQVRLHHRYRHLTEHGKRSTVVNVAIARQLVGFLSAAMTNQPLTSSSEQPQKVAASPDPQPPVAGPDGRCEAARRILDGSMRFQLTTPV
jgi:hypothetical protein